MKSILVIGIGRFGKHLALKFARLGNEVLAVDKEEARVSEVCEAVTAARIGDCKDENVLRELGVNNFDLCFVCTSSDFQSSLEVTSLLKELGAKYVISKADRDIHAKFLLRNGADEVIYPERDMARRTAIRLNARKALDYIELAPDYAIFEIRLPEGWAGKTIRELAVRTRYGVNVIATKEGGRILPLTHADHVFRPDEHLLIAGSQRESAKLLEKP